MIENLRKVVIIVAILNVAYFGVEFAVATAIRSVSLFADSIDFLEDASVNLLIAVALSWSASRRARLGMVLAGILLVPGLATLWTALFFSSRRRHTRSLCDWSSDVCSSDLRVRASARKAGQIPRLGQVQKGERGDGQS